MARKPTARRVLALFGLGLVAGVAAASWFLSQLVPMPAGEAFYVRYENDPRLDETLADLERRGVVRNAWAAGMWARMRRVPQPMHEGTYLFRPGMNLGQVYRASQRPVTQLVRIPEGWWAARIAERLEEYGVTQADEYQELVREVDRFRGEVDFPLPERSLEGYLFPDTYDLPPLLGAEGVIRRQLRAFEQKVIPHVPEGVDLHRSVIIASMIELEAAVDHERARIAGVIENRLRIGMRLQIDATVNYAIQEWKPFRPGEIARIESPYSTYKNAGLPPGPIGSPSLRSLKAAWSPEQHEYLYYVARPDRTHFFSETYDQHLSAIRRARAEFREAGR